tara:strand:- start:705 stop:1724 length:1020 start_codon:yes stop_codon:yes gene_type:complete
MKINSFNFSLPKKLIAQEAKNSRSESKLLVINRKTGDLLSEKFINIDKFLGKNDLIIVNDSKVIPARLHANRYGTKGKVEIFIERVLSDDSFICQMKSTRKIKIGDIVIINDNIELEIKSNNGIFCQVYVKNLSVKKLLSNFGEIPLPPYITRSPNKNDESYYQTIFAKNDGSVAAPTAALHFDEHVMKKIKNKGVKISNITLHIGMGTFSSIKTENINNHRMHSELFCVPKSTVDLIKQCKENNGKIVCVGTTVARALESFYLFKHEEDKFYETDIFIKPGYDFKIVDCLVTNFHLPKSSLLIMIAAFYDTKKILEAYEYAIKNNYKFFSYGDSTLII